MDKVKERISKLGDSFRRIIQIEAQRERREEIEKKNMKENKRKTMWSSQMV